MKNVFLFFIAFVLLSITACNKKNEDTFYFSCYINGQYFEPEKQQGLGEYPITAKLLYDDTQLRISADKSIQSLSLGIIDTSGVHLNNYLLSNNAFHYSRALYYPNLFGSHYETDSLFIGFANITLLDKANMIVAGTFYFDAYNTATKDTVHITDGKFKLKYDLH